MAHMSQEHKKKIAAELKKAMAGTGVRYTLAVQHHSAIVMNIQSAPVDFIANATEVALRKRNDMRVYDASQPRPTSLQVNPYWYQEHFTGKCLEILEKILPVLNRGNHNRSDILSDYHDVGWYVYVNVGQWNKPFQVTR